MPKRKATSKLSGLVGSDDEDILQFTENENAPSHESQEEPPAKKRRGRPRTSAEDATATKASAPARGRPPARAAHEEEESASKTASTRRGQPRAIDRTSEPVDEESNDQENKDPLAAKEATSSKTTRAGRTATTATRGRGRVRASIARPVQTDGEFEYTPTRAIPQQRISEVSETQPTDGPADEVVDEPVLDNDHQTAPYVPSSVVKTARARLATSKNNRDLSPSKRKSGVAVEQSGDPDLRRKIGEITKKHDALESKYRNLREIGVVEANTNMEKLRKQCESITTASNELIASLRSELEAQRTLGSQSRNLQKQLKERDAEMAKLKAQADETRSQLASSQSEIKALQTKLAAARNTAASLEANKIPGSAIKGGAANRATAAATAEAAQVAHLAQLKEDLYTDFTGLIIRDVKDRETDHLYDCIQTGVNGTLHFKLAIPKVASSEYEQAEFQYLPLLDASRDRELVNILPDFLTVDITFRRDQASKFHTRVIDALTKRRTSTS
ncbi:hypothetical protein PMG11_01625 [Penicillium brasilianum]|uniref:Monopolin complex subunit Csm1/Pcs1 C-terminal domain-containing protein n=1 Tax=Penicillium brasilianum TaxID=104259 RepID=A0A0F7THH5_PENBI|nr:hypothetical protein PMG11_01625 [Penicillium brasilianum]